MAGDPTRTYFFEGIDMPTERALLDAELAAQKAEDAISRPGYHTRKIEKGELGEVSKIREELEELEDAIAQGSPVMALIELSDIVGAISEFLRKHHPSITIDDLCTMANITRRAFLNGRR